MISSRSLHEGHLQTIRRVDRDGSAKDKRRIEIALSAFVRACVGERPHVSIRPNGTYECRVWFSGTRQKFMAEGRTGLEALCALAQQAESMADPLVRLSGVLADHLTFG